MREESKIVVPTTEEIDNLRGYRIGTWKTYKNYECIYCQYATLWPSKMEKHQAENDHPWAFPGQNELPEGEVRDDEPRYE
jgi:hypothetical protein